MNKMNKKGFTLIEMLVVIAIIAVLVSIIVPVVSNSTTKAAAATNAANLRSVQSSVQIMVIANAGATLDTNTAGVVKVMVGSTEVGKVDAPKAKALKVDSKELTDVAMTVTLGTDNQVAVSYVTGTSGSQLTWDIDTLAHIAETGAYPTT
ncbi:MAG: type II secretion system protein [Faecousia sp.]